MKIKDILIYTSLIIVTGLITTNIVLSALTGKTILQLDTLLPSNKPTLNRVDICSSIPKITGLSQSNNSQLQVLSKYQEVCQSSAADRMMIFTEMPKDDQIAKSQAEAMAVTLKEFAQYGITPIVIIEPVSEWGLIDFQEFSTGFYDAWITTYFKTLKLNDINDTQMGIWVPFPEANLPFWNHQNARPEDFAKIINRYLKILKKEFPTTHASILLNSATYENDDFEWSSGEYVSLRPYVKDIQKGLVDSFGIQGFPWLPSATYTTGGILDAREFINHKLAVEAADILGVKEIWFNTGTFQSKYTLDQDKQVLVLPGTRQDILNSIFLEARLVQDKGYQVWINIFAEDKSNVNEATNWSYLRGVNGDTGHENVLVNFLSKLSHQNIPVSLFDTTHE